MARVTNLEYPSEPSSSLAREARCDAGLRSVPAVKQRRLPSFPRDFPVSLLPIVAFNGQNFTFSTIIRQVGAVFFCFVCSYFI